MSVSSPEAVSQSANITTPGIVIEPEPGNEEESKLQYNEVNKMALYDKRLKEMRIQFGKMNNKISKLADLLTKTLQVNKRNDQNIKMLNNRLKQLSQNGGGDTLALQSKIDLLQREVSSLKQSELAMANTDGGGDSNKNPLEVLKSFLEKEAKLGDFYNAFVENGFNFLKFNSTTLLLFSLYFLLNHLKSKSMVHQSRLVIYIFTSK